MLLSRRQTLSLLSAVPFTPSSAPVLISAKRNDGVFQPARIRQSIETARSQGRPIHLYFSLMDRSHPDGARCATDPAARERFVTDVHEQIRHLLTNYGPIDTLFHDHPWPLDSRGWQFEKLNRTASVLQPGIAVLPFLSHSSRVARLFPSSARSIASTPSR